MKFTELLTQNTEKAIEKLLALCKEDKDLYNDTLIQQEKWNNYQKNKRGGTISHDNLEIDRTKIVKSLLGIYDLLKIEDLPIPISYTKPQPKQKFIGRIQELKILDSFIESDKKLFTLFAVPQMGKGTLVHQWAATSTFVQEYEYVEIEINDAYQLEKKFFEKICQKLQIQQTEINQELVFKIIEKIGNKKYLLFLNNFEYTLQLTVDFRVLTIKTEFKLLKSLIKELAEQKNQVKIVVSSRFDIDWGKINSEVLTQYQLLGIEKAEKPLLQNYLDKKFTEQEYYSIFDKFEGHIYLLNLAINRVKNNHDKKQLIEFPKQTHQMYLEEFLAEIFDEISTDELQTEFLCLIMLTYQPFKDSNFEEVESFDQIDLKANC